MGHPNTPHPPCGCSKLLSNARKLFTSADRVAVSGFVPTVARFSLSRLSVNIALHQYRVKRTSGGFWLASQFANTRGPPEFQTTASNTHVRKQCPTKAIVDWFNCSHVYEASDPEISVLILGDTKCFVRKESVLFAIYCNVLRRRRDNCPVKTV